MKKPFTGFGVYFGAVMIELDVKIDGVEYIKLNYKLAYSNPALLIVFLGTVAIVLGAVFTGRLDFSNLLASPVPLVGLLVLLYLLVILPVTLFYRARYAYSTLPALYEKVHYTISEKGITQKGQTFTEKFAWTDFAAIKQTQNWILLLKTKNAGIFIPKNAFKSEEELEKVVLFAFQNNLRILKG